MEPIDAKFESSRFSTETEEMLRYAGWHLGRAVSEARLEQWYFLRWQYEVGFCRIFPAALRVLREFGDLHVKNESLGGIFKGASFHLNPLLALGVADGRWISSEWILQTTLYPLGLCPAQDEVIAINTEGQIFIFSEELHFVGATFDQYLENERAGLGHGQMIEMFDYAEELEQAHRVRSVVRRFHAVGGAIQRYN